MNTCVVCESEGQTFRESVLFCAEHAQAWDDWAEAIRKKRGPTSPEVNILRWIGWQRAERRKTMSLRLTRRASSKLTRLAHAQGTSRTAAVERLIMESGEVE